MSIMNLPKFYEGQKVVQIRTGKIVTVLKVIRFPCGCVGYECTVDELHDPVFDAITCYAHPNIWIDAGNFKHRISKESTLAPLQESPFPSLTMKQVIETEKLVTCLN